MSYLDMLNNEMQSIMVVLLFACAIIMTIALLCEMFSNRKLGFDLFVVCKVLNVALCVVWAFIFFNFKNTPICEILAYYSAVIFVFEMSLMFHKKAFFMAVDFPFFIMMLPFWKYANATLSVVFIVIGVGYLFAKSLTIFLNSITNLKSNINYYSLKEALDGLKTAVMFESKFDVVYENLAMKNLLEQLKIKQNQSSSEIWQNLKSRQNSKIIDEQNILVFLDEKTYSFSIIKQSKTQIYAFDITKEYLTTSEIQNKQNELKVKQSEIVKMIENVDEIEKQKEVLSLKSKLHDIIGQRLFILHHILESIEEKNFDLNHVKNMIATMLNEIDCDEISEVEAMQNSIVTAFEMIGFHIEISGEMPKETQKAKALIQIIRECATNAIRHANATKLFVKILENKIEIFDNGKFTNQSIVEGTGIKGMRPNAETLGGELTTSAENGFRVIIKLKNETNTASD